MMYNPHGSDHRTLEGCWMTGNRNEEMKLGGSEENQASLRMRTKQWVSGPRYTIKMVAKAVGGYPVRNAGGTVPRSSLQLTGHKESQCLRITVMSIVALFAVYTLLPALVKRYDVEMPALKIE